MSDFLKVIGWVTIIAGIIVGVEFGKANDPVFALVGLESDFRWTVAIIWWGSGVASGVIFLALGRILEIQNKIYRAVAPETISQQTELSSEEDSLAQSSD